MNFELKIIELVCRQNLEGMQNVIVTINYLAQKEGAELVGTLGLAAPHEAAFIPYSEVSESMVMGWLENGINIDETDLALDCEIAYKKDIIVVNPLPWIE